MSVYQMICGGNPINDVVLSVSVSYRLFGINSDDNYDVAICRTDLMSDHVKLILPDKTEIIWTGPYYGYVKQDDKIVWFGHKITPGDTSTVIEALHSMAPPDAVDVPPDNEIILLFQKWIVK